MTNILHSWPFPYKPRNNQISALQWIEQNQDKRHLILECPVGSGKSNIGITYSMYKTPAKGSSYILTPQKILQEQYETSFRDIDKIDITSFYGRSNYSCQSRNTSCDIGSVLKPSCDSCPYKIARGRARMVPNTVMNYKLAFVSFNFTDFFKKRPLIVMDECHTLENHLVEFDAVEVTQHRAEKYALPFKAQTKLRDALKWLVEEYIPKLTPVHAKLEVESAYIKDRMSTEDHVSKQDLAKIREADSVGEHLHALTNLTNDDPTSTDAAFVLVHEKTMFKFKRLYGRNTFQSIVEQMGDQFLYMSSTILDKVGFCSDLGINPKEAAFLSLPSEFDPSHRPVVYMPNLNMNIKWKDDENAARRNALVKSIKKILSTYHSTESGIIHTGNYAIAKWLVGELEGEIDHRIYHHNPGSRIKREHAINAFMEDAKPAVLISPSITEGLDLKDDLGRFAIIAKIPYGNLADQWISKRMNIDHQWYQRNALIDIIQGGGRVVRGPEDYGFVYITDGGWAKLMQRTRAMIPKWWLQAYTALRP